MQNCSTSHLPFLSDLQARIPILWWIWNRTGLLESLNVASIFPLRIEHLGKGSVGPPHDDYLVSQAQCPSAETQWFRVEDCLNLQEHSDRDVFVSSLGPQSGIQRWLDRANFSFLHIAEVWGCSGVKLDLNPLASELVLQGRCHACKVPSKFGFPYFKLGFLVRPQFCKGSSWEMNRLRASG